MNNVEPFLPKEEYYTEEGLLKLLRSLTLEGKVNNVLLNVCEERFETIGEIGLPTHLLAEIGLKRVAVYVKKES